MQAQRLSNLTAIRFFAAIWVALYHARSLCPLPDFASRLVGFGYVGVDIFFILSGFILCYSYLPRPMNHRQFWVARFARIWPVYAVGLMLNAPIFYRDTIVKDHKAILTIGVPVLLLIQSWVPHAALAWNSPGWSLSTETFFYAAFPLLLRRAVYFFQKHFLLTSALLWVGGSMPIVCFALMFRHQSNPIGLSFIKFNPVIRVPEFLLGVGVGSYFLAGNKLRYPRLMAALSIAGLAAAGIFISATTPYPLLHNGLLAPISALLIYSLACVPTSPGKLLILLGDSSYSLYILHRGILVYLQVLQKHGIVASNSFTILLAYLSICIVASIASYKLVEQPSGLWIKEKAKRVQCLTTAENQRVIRPTTLRRSA